MELILSFHLLCFIHFHMDLLLIITSYYYNIYASIMCCGRLLTYLGSS